MDRRIFVLGTDHALQGAEKLETSLKVDDPTYAVLVARQIAEYSLDFIFEEIAGFGPTTASKMQRPGLGYLDVDKSGPEREPSKIILYGSHFAIYDKGKGDPDANASHYKIAPEIEREKSWVATVCKEKFRGALVICGLAHCFSVATRLESEGFESDVFIYMPFAKLAKLDGKNAQSVG